jgi:ABC-type Na+ efflux pump permease subunit
MKKQMITFIVLLAIAMFLMFSSLACSSGDLVKDGQDTASAMSTAQAAAKKSVPACLLAAGDDTAKAAACLSE